MASSSPRTDREEEEPCQAQWDHLINCLEKNKKVIYCSPKTSDTAEIFWLVISNELNAIIGGTWKTYSEWYKIWKDLVERVEQHLFNILVYDSPANISTFNAKVLDVLEYDISGLPCYSEVKQNPQIIQVNDINSDIDKIFGKRKRKNDINSENDWDLNLLMPNKKLKFQNVHEEEENFLLTLETSSTYSLNSKIEPHFDDYTEILQLLQNFIQKISIDLELLKTALNSIGRNI